MPCDDSNSDTVHIQQDENAVQLYVVVNPAREIDLGEQAMKEAKIDAAEVIRSL